MFLIEEKRVWQKGGLLIIDNWALPWGPRTDDQGGSDLLNSEPYCFWPRQDQVGQWKGIFLRGTNMQTVVSEISVGMP